MMKNPLQRLRINDDVDAEFGYWKSRFLISAWTAAGFALAAGMAIALWPPGSGSEELRGFARGVWTAFVEAAFWLGFLLGLLWGAAKRLGSGLSGILPWTPSHQLSRKAAASRFFGQWASGLALAGIFLMIGQRAAEIVVADAGPLLTSLTPLIQTCFGSAIIFAMAALIGRERMDHGRRSSGNDDR